MKKISMILVLIVLAGCRTTTMKTDATSYRAGTAKVNITPQKPIWLSGYGGRQGLPKGTGTELWVRALALEDGKRHRLVVVSMEILGLPHSINESIRKKARRQYGLRDRELMLVATHTHAGPVIPERPSVPIMYALNAENNKRVNENAIWLEKHILNVIGKALEDMEPVQISFGQGKGSFAMNRRVAVPGGVNFGENRNGPVDHAVPVLVARKPDGNSKAVLFGYACHCTTLGGNYLQYHGDYAGAAMNELERRNAGVTAVFVTGCGGDANPSPRDTAQMAMDHGKSLADAVIAVASGKMAAISAPIQSRYLRTELPLDKLPTREEWEQLRKERDVYVARHARENLKLLNARKLPTKIPYPIQTAQFGTELTVVALGGEVVVDYVLRLKRELGGEKLWVIAYANEVPCYIPSRRILEEGGYEAGWGAKGKRKYAGGNILYYGWPVPLAPATEEKVISSVYKLLGGKRQ